MLFDDRGMGFFPSREAIGQTALVCVSLIFGALPSQAQWVAADTEIGSRGISVSGPSYESQRDRFFVSAMRSGSVCYRDAVVASYRREVLSEELWKAKQAWREEMSGLGFVFRCDYGTWENRVALESVEMAPGSLGPGELLAEYEALSNRIRLSPAALGSTLLHEAGHSLQRRAICGDARHSRPPQWIVSKIPTEGIGGTSARLIEQYRYLSSQDEFEVRLQDLNRAFASLLGRGAILDELDTLRALAAIGVPLEREEIRKAFDSVGRVCGERAFAVFTGTPVSQAIEELEAFPDARDLVILRRLALKIEAAAWPRLLAKVLFEAPGHL